MLFLLVFPLLFFVLLLCLAAPCSTLADRSTLEVDASFDACKLRRSDLHGDAFLARLTRARHAVGHEHAFPRHDAVEEK